MSEISVDIGEQINNEMKEAMKAKDRQRLNVVRMIKAAMQEKLNLPDMPQQADNKLWQQVMASYQKKMQKALVEYEKLGDAGAEKAEGIRYEINYIEPFLPAKLGDAELALLVDEAISSSGASAAKDLGRVMGAIMKTHKDSVDSQKLRTLIAQKLGAS